MTRSLTIFAILAMTACTNVQPWERGALARPDMQFSPDPLDATLLDQIYDSKEASSGGNQSAGAGCGCN
ncbi:MAG: DUF4266 domain-containing protein [Pseudomonadales bacterium]|nr:DUF4266 domain-containing protein [Pseudomonadales bacterium]